jgi:hypothetical protein
VSLIDDRGLWIRPLGDDVVECEEGAAKPPEVVRAGERFEACVALPVPVRTPVKAVAFGSPSADADPQPWIRVSVSPTDPPVVITLADTTMQAGFDIVMTRLATWVIEDRPRATSSSSCAPRWARPTTCSCATTAGC